VTVDLDRTCRGAERRGCVSYAQPEDVDVQRFRDAVRVDQEEELALRVVRVIQRDLRILHQSGLAAAGAAEPELARGHVALLLGEDRLEVQRPELAGR